MFKRKFDIFQKGLEINDLGLLCAMNLDFEVPTDCHRVIVVDEAFQNSLKGFRKKRTQLNVLNEVET